MNGRDQLKRMKYRAIDRYDGEAWTMREAGAATCLARLYGRFDLLKRMCRDWQER
jgi:hypothetical protein